MNKLNARITFEIAGSNRIRNIKTVIVIGQGIAGSLLAMELWRRGIRVIIYNSPGKQSSSLQAGGLLHAYNSSYNGRDEHYAFFLEHAIACYRQLEVELAGRFIGEKKLITGFEKDAASCNQNSLPPISGHLQKLLQTFFFGSKNAKYLKDVFWLDVGDLFQRLKEFLKVQTYYFEEDFDPGALILNAGDVRYKGEAADHIIFCDGVFNAHDPFFTLPFNYNRGEYLLLKIEEELPDYLFENKYRLVKKGKGIYWFGASNSWGLEEIDYFRNDAVKILEGWLKVPFQVTGHFSAERPTSPGQFPYVGLDPSNERLGILNGLGSRGLLFAPYYAKQLSEILAEERQSIDHYDWKRFAKLMVKN